MSRARKYNQYTLDIMERFFIAVEACHKANLLKPLSNYFAEIGVFKNNFYIQRKDRTRGYFEVGWITPLIRDCGVSASWILTGQGTMFVPAFTKPTPKTAEMPVQNPV